MDVECKVVEEMHENKLIFNLNMNFFLYTEGFN
jgi:hypothetical protein